MIEDRVSCPHCGFLNKPEALYCELCQKPLQPQVEQKKKKGINFSMVPGAPVKGGRIDFYQLISKNKRNSFFLIFFFLLFFVAFGAAIGYLNGNYMIGMVITSVTGLIWVLIAIFFGDEISLSLLNAREVTHDEEPTLFNVVEEMSIAAGIPMPRVYVVETDGMNAFAVGFKPEKSAVAVTRGLLKNLSRDELQGVIGHEISHIRFYDTRIMMMVSVLVGLVVIFSDLALRSFFGYRRRSRYSYRRSEGGAEGNPMLLIIFIIFIALSPLIATILQMAISRRREFLADAGSVELTRNPSGLRSALEKLLLGDVYIETASKGNQHMFIVNPLKADADVKDSIFETHPPIQKRIALLRAMEV